PPPGRRRTATARPAPGLRPGWPLPSVAESPARWPPARLCWHCPRARLMAGLCRGPRCCIGCPRVGGGGRRAPAGAEARTRLRGVSAPRAAVAAGFGPAPSAWYIAATRGGEADVEGCCLRRDYRDGCARRRVGVAVTDRDAAAAEAGPRSPRPGGCAGRRGFR